MEAQTSNAVPLVDLSSFQQFALGEIARRDGVKGLTIKEALEGLLDTNEVHHGRLYPNLDTLAEKGLVKKGKVDDRTNSYTITRRGRRELRAHANYWNNVMEDME